LKKILLTLFVVYFASFSYGQNKYAGKYKEYYGSSIHLYSDFTFEYSDGYPPFRSWANGKWKASNDTLYFGFVPVYDTVSHYDTLRFPDSPRRVKIYTIELSCDGKSNLITHDQAIIEKNIFSSVQNSKVLPEKLFYKNRVLYRIEMDGKLMKKKYKNIYSHKKISSGFLSVEN